MATVPDIDERTTAWVDAGLIDERQAQDIRSFEAGRSLAAGDGAVRDQLAAILGGIGGLLVGLGVLLSVAANWDAIGDGAKLATICVGMVVAYGLGLLADLRGAPRWAGTAGYVVGTLVFAGGVFLLGQAFNVQAHDPLGFLVVALFASAVAVLAGRRLVGWIAALAWMAWASHEIFVSIEGESDDRAVAAVVGAGLLLSLAALGLGWLLEGIAERARASQRPGDDAPLRAEVVVLARPFRGVALAALLLVLVPASFAWHATDSPEVAPATAQVLVTFTLALLASIGVDRLAPLAARRPLALALALAAAIVLVGLLVQGLVLTGILANVLLAAGGLGMVVLGLAEDRGDAYAWGVLWLVVLVAARYLDVLALTDVGGLGFLGAGALLLACAWLVGRSRTYWRERGRT